MDGGYEEMMGGPGWMMAWMVIWLLVVLALIGIAIFAIVRFTSQRTESSDHALDVLRRRYAAGEIDHDEFEARRSHLGRSP